MPEVFEYMTMDTSEKQFEKDIEQALLSDGYKKLLSSSYNIESMLFEDVFVEFVKTSQPNNWKRYEK